MKWFTLLGIFSVIFVVVSAKPRAEIALLNSAPSNENTALGEISPRDWLSDIIKAILGIDVPVLLTQIDTCLKGLNRLVTSAVQQLNSTMGAVDEDIKRDINLVIESALSRSLIIVAPLLRDLGIVLPIISDDKIFSVYKSLISNANTNEVVVAGTNDFVSDVIESLLGMSLEELLTGIATTLIEMEQHLDDTFQSLKDIALRAPAIAALMNQIIDDCVIESQELIEPILNKLYQVLPIKVGHKI